MALGGGIWTAQNKGLPGTYINFSSAARANASLTAGGVVAVPLSLSWGPEETVVTLKAGTIAQTCRDLFGYSYGAPEMLALRELFRNAETVLCYRLGTGAAKAENDYAAAKYAGARGNDIKLVIEADPDGAGFIVETYLDGTLADSQRAKSAAELKPNGLVDFKAEATLAATAGTALAGGSDGTAPDGEAYAAFLAAVEGYSFNVLACPAADAAVVAVFASFTERMCREAGANFQLVAYRPQTDSELVIGVDTAAEGGLPAYGLVYWVAGAAAACPVNGSLTNRLYDGELTLTLAQTQAELEAAIAAGKFVLHNVNGAARVLEDVNTLKTLTETRGEDFKSNQTVRLCHDAANRIALLFNTQYLGMVPNDANGRISLWNDVCKIFQSYEKARAIEHFDTASVEVLPGEAKDAVRCRVSGLSVIRAMSKLYMDIVIA